MQKGWHDGYQWLEAEQDLRAFLQLCPEVIAGKYLAITSVDSGSFVPSAADVAKGWKNVGGIAYSPILETPADLPPRCCCRECCGFDEWHIFEDPPALGNLCHENFFVKEIARENVFAFINSYLRVDPVNPITELFWQQIAWMQPESYIGTGVDYLIFATRNKALFEIVRSVLEDSLQ